MGNAQGVEIRYGLAHLFEDVPSLFFFKSSSIVQIVHKVSILSNFRHDEAMEVGLDNLEDVDYVWVGDLLENEDFSRQKFVHIFLVQLALVNNLDGNLKINEQIVTKYHC